MKTFKIGITIKAETPDTVKEVGNLIQNTVNLVEQEDIVKLLTKVVKNPSIIKKALKFI
jgi:hypothetical protein